ncbi:MAG: 3-deoxy-manno-octulosonate cytidylyltransferase [Bacteroidetes bacterium]|nr:3-deoxy-manno-octulosonate cytidylyltransferase [Bacteroidota bacterium]
MKILGIIPARYASTRFPGKPLVDIKGKSMIQRVYEQATKCKSLSAVVVATDDERIFSHVLNFGGKAVMTSVDHPSGTDRCMEALEKFGGSYDVVINVQGDEPFIQPEQLEQLIACFSAADAQIATLAKKIESVEDLLNSNLPKIIFNQNKTAIYFSRSPIPGQKSADYSKWLSNHLYYRHIGLYGYRTEVLKEISKLSPSPLEKTESLEQLRWLEAGYTIKVGITELETIAIDTPEDLKKV